MAVKQLQSWAQTFQTGTGIKFSSPRGSLRDITFMRKSSTCISKTSCPETTSVTYSFTVHKRNTSALLLHRCASSTPLHYLHLHTPAGSSAGDQSGGWSWWKRDLNERSGSVCVCACLELCGGRGLSWRLSETLTGADRQTHRDFIKWDRLWSCGAPGLRCEDS